jgi:hypothetical protein
MQNLKLSIAITVFLCAILSIWLPSLQNTITVLTALLGLLEIYSQRDRIKEFVTTDPPPPPIEPTCGDRPIDLADQRLHVSLSFGSYFTSLLEKEHLYTGIPGQLVCARAAQSHIKDPLQYALWTLIDAKGARILVLAAEGGMGKSTLASKLIRCLYEREDINMILGDSAKQHLINPTTGSVDTITPGYDSATSFLERLCVQLGLLYQPDLSDAQQLTNIRDRLIGRRAIIVVDNLESVQQSDRLIKLISSLVNRHVRAIITTRIASGFDEYAQSIVSIQVTPLKQIDQARGFLEWHVRQYQADHQRLAQLVQHPPSHENLAWLITHSSGIPLLMQVLLSEVARTSWLNVAQRTQLFGQELLDSLYLDHWNELANLDAPGHLARTILEFVNREIHQGDRITYKQLYGLAEDLAQTHILDNALTLLHERFLIVNSERKDGNYSIYPSLSDFIQTQLLNDA